MSGSSDRSFIENRVSTNWELWLGPGWAFFARLVGRALTRSAHPLAFGVGCAIVECKYLKSNNNMLDLRTVR